MSRHRLSALGLLLVALTCAGCEKRLQARYVCTDELTEELLTGEKQTSRPVLDFRRDGTVYLDDVFSGQSQTQGTYSINGNQVRITILGGLQVNTGTMRGAVMKTDFRRVQWRTVTKTAGEKGVMDLGAMATDGDLHVIPEGKTYETRELETVELTFRRAGGGFVRSALAAIAVIALALFALLLVAIILPKLNIRLGAGAIRTYARRPPRPYPSKESAPADQPLPRPPPSGAATIVDPAPGRPDVVAQDMRPDRPEHALPPDLVAHHDAASSACVPSEGSPQPATSPPVQPPVADSAASTSAPASSTAPEPAAMPHSAATGSSLNAPRLVLIAGLVCLIAAVALAGFVLGRSGSDRHEPQPSSTFLSVPDVTGLPVDTAHERLIEAGFDVGNSEERYDNQWAEGLVCGQSPSGGTAAARGASVGLVVSKGAESNPDDEETATEEHQETSQHSSIPDVIGLSVETAQTRLTEAGFNSITGEERYDSQWTAGLVCGQSPSGGVLASEGATVSLTVSKGAQRSRNDVQAIRDRHETWRSSLEGHDLATHLDCFWQDAHIDGMNYQRYRTYQAKEFSRQPGMAVTISGLDVDVAGDMATSRFVQRFRGTGPKSNYESVGQMTMVWERRGGEWRIVHEKLEKIASSGH